MHSTIPPRLLAACAALVSVASGQEVNWQQRNSAQPGTETTLGAGANVNPTSTSQLRIQVTNIPANCRVISIEIVEEDWSVQPDSTVQTLPSTQTGATAETGWISVPQEISDAGFHAEFYVLVTIECGSGSQASRYTIISSLINVPDAVVNENTERTSSESTIEASGSLTAGAKTPIVGGSGTLEAKTKSTTTSKSTVDYAATYRDPTIDVTLLLHSGPASWAQSLSVSPSTVVIGPGQAGSAAVVFGAGTEPGEGTFSIRSRVRETGLVDETDVLRLVVHPEGAGPGTHTGNPAQVSTPGLAPAAIGVGSIQQINFCSSPALPAGTWLCTMTATTLPGGGNGLYSGTYVAQTDTFAPDPFALALNATGTEFGLMMNPSFAIAPSGAYAPGTVAVWDSGSTTTAKCAVRPTIAAPWTVVGNIRDIPPGYVDPALAVIEGELWLLWVEGRSPGRQIVGAPFDPMRPTRFGQPSVARFAGEARIFVSPHQVPEHRDCHSPTPITGADGDTEALLFDANASGSQDSDPFVKPLCDPSGAGPVFALENTPGWSNNGGLVAGQVFQAYSGSGAYHAYALRLALLTGDDEVATRGFAGRRLDVALHAPILAPTDPPFVGLLLLAPAQATLASTLPGIENVLALPLASLGVVPVLSFPAIPRATGSAVLSAPIEPYHAGSLAAQGLLVQVGPGGLRAILTNHVELRF